jgi:hypothetical protein
MPVNQIVSANNRGTANTDNLWSPAVWQGIPVADCLAGAVDCVIQQLDFGQGFKPSANVNAAEAYWDRGLMVFGSDGAAVTADKAVGKNAGVSISSDGDNEGAAIRAQFQPFRIDRGRGKFAFEVQGWTSTITDTKHGFFMGLCDSTAATATVPIAAAGTLADLNFVGVHRLEGDGDKLDVVYKANGVTQVTQYADAHTLVADAVFSFGMTFDPDNDFGGKGKNVLRFYFNNIPLTDTSSYSGYKVIPTGDGDDFPNDVGLGFIFSVLNATASTPGDTTCMRFRAIQLL